MLGPMSRSGSRLGTALALVLAIACSGAPKPQTSRPSPSPASPASTTTTAAPLTGPDHIVVIALENKEYGEVVGSSAAPYLNAVASTGVLISRGYAATHPSLPNYFAFVAGGTFGVTTDCTTCSIRGRNLVDQLAAHDLSWKAYMQAMPRPCTDLAFAGSGTHVYAKRHDPFMYFHDIRTRPARCARIVPLRQLTTDLTHRIPRFAWITPDLCHDMHSCPIATGDAWLHRWIPRILPKLGADGILMIVFDEGVTDEACCPRRGSGGGGHVVTVIAGPGAGAGVTLSRPLNHYSILRLIEDAWGLPRLRHAADRATPTIWGWRA
jgi:phosphatidylinositol-3-phosphatase